MHQIVRIADDHVGPANQAVDAAVWFGVRSKDDLDPAFPAGVDRVAGCEPPSEQAAGKPAELGSGALHASEAYASQGSDVRRDDPLVAARAGADRSDE
jgi:hypothetical protein